VYFIVPSLRFETNAADIRLKVNLVQEKTCYRRSDSPGRPDYRPHAKTRNLLEQVDEIIALYAMALTVGRFFTPRRLLIGNATFHNNSTQYVETGQGDWVLTLGRFSLGQHAKRTASPVIIAPGHCVS